jgi:hypothetical protein
VACTRALGAKRATCHVELTRWNSVVNHVPFIFPPRRSGDFQLKVRVRDTRHSDAPYFVCRKAVQSRCLNESGRMSWRQRYRCFHHYFALERRIPWRTAGAARFSHEITEREPRLMPSLETQLRGCTECDRGPLLSEKPLSSDRDASIIVYGVVRAPQNIETANPSGRPPTWRRCRWCGPFCF